MAKISKNTIKNRMNKDISNVVSGYHVSLIDVVESVFAAIQSHGGMAVQEDGKRWEGMLMGDASSCVIGVTHPDYKPAPRMEYPYHLNLCWYRMPSGKWEVVAYIA